MRLTLTAEKPAGITREPVYAGAPLYTSLRLGDGPNNTYCISVDRPAGGTWRVYLDANRNGDLTDDGDGAWRDVKPQPQLKRTLYGINHYTLKASWGADGTEVAYGDYGVNLYTFDNLPALIVYRTAGRVGELTLDGQRHRIAVLENDADALFDKPVATDEKSQPTEPVHTRPVWMFVDWADDGTFKRPGEQDYTYIDIRAPFLLGQVVYEATLTPDGAQLTLAPSDKSAAAPLPRFP